MADPDSMRVLAPLQTYLYCYLYSQVCELVFGNSKYEFIRVKDRRQSYIRLTRISAQPVAPTGMSFKNYKEVDPTHSSSHGSCTAHTRRLCPGRNTAKLMLNTDVKYKHKHTAPPLPSSLCPPVAMGI